MYDRRYYDEAVMNAESDAMQRRIDTLIAESERARHQSLAYANEAARLARQAETIAVVAAVVSMIAIMINLLVLVLS